jgi:hypothetical protein
MEGASADYVTTETVHSGCERMRIIANDMEAISM